MAMARRRPHPSIASAMIQRRKVILGALGATAVVAAAGGSSVSSASAGPTVAAGPSPSSPPPAVPGELSITPATGAKGVSPGKPVVVTVAGGTFQAATVTAGSQTVDGAVQPDGSWRSTEPLAYGRTYRVTASAVDGLGATVEKTSAFTTVKPRTTAKVTFQANAMNSLKAGNIYGVG